MQFLLHTLISTLCLWTCFAIQASLEIRTLVGILLFIGLKTSSDLLLDTLQKGCSTRKIIAGITGFFIGIVLANGISVPFLLFSPLRSADNIALALCWFNLSAAALSSYLFIQYEPALLRLPMIRRGASNSNFIKLLDTNTILDGRILKLTEISFVEGLILIPDFVMEEVKRIADDEDELRKQRGKNALKTVKQLLDENDYIQRYETEPTDDVDSALLRLANDLNAKIVTSDANLIDLAAAKDIPIISINEISIACQMTYLKGECLRVKIVAPGNADGQGIAYTEDGTMIVVKDGIDDIGQTIPVTITNQLQSKFGIMLFAEKNF